MAKVKKVKVIDGLEIQEKEKGADIMTFIRYLTEIKKPWDSLTDLDKKAFSPFMINLWIGMSKDMVEIINELQIYTLNQLDKREAWKVYLEYLPNTKIYFNYIKSKSEVKYNSELIDLFTMHFECSKEEAIDNLELLYNMDDGIVIIMDLLSKYGFEQKKISNMIKIKGAKND